MAIAPVLARLVRTQQNRASFIGMQHKNLNFDLIGWLLALPYVMAKSSIHCTSSSLTTSLSSSRSNGERYQGRMQGVKN